MVVAAEETKDVGKASALAKQLGIKDMRAAEDDYIKELLGDSKATGAFSTLGVAVFDSLIALAVSPLSIDSNNAASVLLVLSDSLSSLESVSLADTTLSGSDLLKYTQSTNVKTQTISFSERGAAAAAVVPATGVHGAVPVAKPAAPSSKPGKDPANVVMGDPSLLTSLGVTIKKDQEDFGGWYKQVR